MDIQKEREAFEKQGFLSFYLANLIFDEAQNVYKPNESLIRTGEEWEWRAFKNQTVVVNTAWAAWQARAKAQAVPEWIDYEKQSPRTNGRYQIFIEGEQIAADWENHFCFSCPISGEALIQEKITHWSALGEDPKEPNSYEA